MPQYRSDPETIKDGHVVTEKLCLACIYLCLIHPKGLVILLISVMPSLLSCIDKTYTVIFYFHQSFELN